MVGERFGLQFGFMLVIHVDSTYLPILADETCGRHWVWRPGKSSSNLNASSVCPFLGRIRVCE